MFCDRLHAWLLIQTRLTTLLTSLIARQSSWPQTEWRYHPKPYLLVTQMVDVCPFRVVLGQVYRGLTGGFLLLRIFSVATSVSPHVCFIFGLNLISLFLR